MTEQSLYDVFLSHNEEDKPAVEKLARRLEDEARLHPFLDKWHLIPGEPFQEAIEEALKQSRTCAVFIGPGGTSPWQNEEMRAAIDRRVGESEGRFRVIPVLLPGAERGERGRLPTFLIRTTWVEFGESLDDADAFRYLVAGIKGEPPGRGADEAIYQSVCPYRGLQAFEEEHAPFFFGREAATEWLVNDLKHSHFLAVIGPSGSGKSSLVRAGLVPALRRGELPNSQGWPLYVFRPGHLPLENLAVVLRQVFGLSDDPLALAQLIDGMAADRRQLHLTTRLALADAPPDHKIVLMVDQFEEIFTLCQDESQRGPFIDNLLYASAVEGGQVVVVLAMRADFYGKCATYPDLAARITGHQMLVSPMTGEELGQAIERPAQLAGLEFEAGLVDTLLSDVQDEPGALPLLQHALLELWERRAGNRLTFDAYREIGGIQGAVAHRAEAVYAGLNATQQDIAQRIIMRLTQPGEGTEDTRRRATMAELLPARDETTDNEAVVQKLADARLVTTGKNERGEEIIDLAHEALIRGWPRLRTWIDENRVILHIHRRLTEAANEWARRDRDRSYLYRGTQLAEVRKIAPASDLSTLERAFIRASKRAHRRRLATRAAMVILSLLVVVLSAVIIRQIQRSRSPWQPVEGFPDDPALSLAATDGTSPIYYVGTENLGVARSEDGSTWTLFRQGLPTAEKPAGGVEGKDVRDVWPLAIDALDPRRIFAFVETNGIYKSENGGESWEASNAGLPVGLVADLAVRGDLVLAAFNIPISFERGLYASLDGGTTWELVGGQGEAPLDQAYSVCISPDGNRVYAGAERGLYSSSIGPPWTWEHVIELASVELIVPAGDGDGFYLATFDVDQDQGDIYHWRPGEQARRLATVDDQPYRLAPHPDPPAPVAVYVLLLKGQVLAVTDSGEIEPLGDARSGTCDLLAVSHPKGKGIWLLSGHDDGLLEYQGEPATEQR